MDMIILIAVLLFGTCVYIESNYIHIIRNARKISEPTKSSKYYNWVIDITDGFFFTIGKWLEVAIVCAIIAAMIAAMVYGCNEVEPDLIYGALWWIDLFVVIGIGYLWYFYLRKLIKRGKQIYSRNQKHRMVLKFLIFTLWILFIMIVPYAAMYITNYAIKPSDYIITPDQYERDGTVYPQILQEVANTNAAILSEVRLHADRLYQTMLTGIISSAIVLGFLIFYRTRKL